MESVYFKLEKPVGPRLENARGLVLNADDGDRGDTERCYSVIDQISETSSVCLVNKEAHRTRL